MQWLVCDGLSQGYRPVVMSFRGLGGILLRVQQHLFQSHYILLLTMCIALLYICHCMQTPRAYCANTDDLAPLISHLQSYWPSVPIVGLGVSMGG